MKKYSNATKIPITTAVWLAQDSYDGKSEAGKTISVTTLMKSTRQTLLTKDMSPTEGNLIELSELVPSRMGTAFHDSVENAWHNYAENLEALGYAQELIDRVRINPKDEDLFEGIVPVYLEQREAKEIHGWTVSGKYDIIIMGRIEDVKSTSTYSFTAGKNTEKYRVQLSIYRWLNQEKITQDVGAIQFIFTDWNANKAKSDSAYPQCRVMEYEIDLLSIAETEQYVRSRLKALDTYWDSPEPELPLCTDTELWMNESEYKYYAKADAKRATKNFGTDAASAYHHRAQKGVGEVREIKAEPKACKWCTAVSCSQRDGYIASGILTL